MDAILPLIGVALGAVLTYAFGRISANAAAAREDQRAAKADAQRLATNGREHAARALEVIRPAQKEARKRTPEEGSYHIETGDLRLDVAEAEIDLIPDPDLRRRLVSVLSLVRYPSTLSNSSYSEGWPVETQREGLYLLRQALAAYIREEQTPGATDRLAVLAKANEDAHAEHDQWHAERLEEQKKSAETEQAAPA